jgi:hypothetical protein
VAYRSGLPLAWTLLLKSFSLYFVTQGKLSFSLTSPAKLI